MFFEEHPDVTQLISFRLHGTNSCFVNKFVFCMAVDVLIDKMETNMPGLKLNAAFVRLPSHLFA